MPARRAAMPRLDSTFAALADPTRRRVVEALIERPRRAGELTDLVAMSPPALSRHLRTLRRAGVIVDEGIDDDARVRLYRVSPGELEPL
jgi:DNA-binding transcriptional ArsR family regulator